MQSKRFWAGIAGAAVFIAGVPIIAQKKAAAPVAAGRDTVAKPMSEKDRKRKEAQLKKELETPWKKWLDNDVTYIITDEERKAFKRFNTDEEREQFVEQFWLRRDQIGRAHV